MFFYSRRFLIFILLCLAGAIGFTGYQAYRQQWASAESAMRKQIKLIGDLKALEISQWLKERQGDAKVLSHSFAFTAGPQDFLRDPGSAAQQQSVLTWLQTLRDGYDYAAVALVDSQGRVLLAVPETGRSLEPQARALVQQALTGGDVVFSDLYRISDDSSALGPPLRLDFVAPLLIHTDSTTDVLGALLLRVDPQDFLYPLLQLWPTPSATAEALLVRRNGNTLTFLSPLRHHAAMPLSFTLPLTTPELIAAQSFLQGGAKEVKGVDYRGEPVLASFRPILDSPWHLVAKVDQKEVNERIQQYTDSILSQILLGLLVTGSVIGLLWRRQSRRILETKAVELENQVQARTAELMTEIERRKASEQALRRERNRAQQYLDIVQVVIVVLDSQGRVLLLNQTGCEQLGYSEMDLLDRNWFETVIPDSDRARTLEGFQRLLQQRPGMTDFFENRIRTRDGQERLYAWHNKIMTTSAGTLIGTISAGEDITERRSLEQAVRESEAKLRAFFESDAIGMLFGDIHGHIFDVNQRLLDMIGYTRADLESGRLNWRDITPPAFLPLDEVHIAEARDRGACTPYEKQYIRKDGFRIWVLVGYVLVEPEREQSVAFIVDLTQRKQAEAELHRQKEILQTIFDNIPVMIAFLDEQGRHTLVNREWERVLGWSLEEARHRDMLAEFYPDQEYRRYALDYILHPPEGFADFKTRIRTGRVLDTSWANVLLSDGMSIGIGIDISERKKTENALRHARDDLEARVAERTRELFEANQRLQGLDSLKSMFIASMSHELRTPLNSIIGFTGVLLQGLTGPLNGKQHDYLRRVNNAGKHLLGLINDIIDISKIETGKIRPDLETFPLVPLINEVLNYFRPGMDQKGLKLSVQIPDGLVLHTDRKRLLQCLTNYLDNAYKYTEHGEIRLTVKVKEDKVLRFAVQDTGIGIPEDKQTALFKAFSRIDSPLTRSVPGTGLGLYLTRKLATEVLNGHAGVISNEGQGSTFWLDIPIDHKSSSGTENI